MDHGTRENCRRFEESTEYWDNRFRPGGTVPNNRTSQLYSNSKDLNYNQQKDPSPEGDGRNDGRCRLVMDQEIHPSRISSNSGAAPCSSRLSATCRPMASASASDSTG